jgi:NitT/TauT family transport system substrate-binding protein
VRLVPIGGPAADDRRAGRPARVLASATALVAGLFVVTGCGILGGSSAPAPPPVKADITVAETPNVGDAPLFMALQQQFFRNAGVNVHIINYSSTRAELRDLRAGRVDVAYGDYADMFYAQAQALTLAKGNQAKSSLNLTVVADGYDAVPNTMEVLALPKSGIVNPKNLVGKTVGTAPAEVMPTNTQGQPYSLDTVATQSVLNNDNVNPDAIKWQSLPSQALLTDLASGHVSAILATEPTIFEAESQLGAIPVLDSCAGATANLPLYGYFSLHSFAQRNHAGLVAFRNALDRAQAEAGASGSTVRNTLEGSEGMSVADASLLTIGQFPTTVNANDLQRVVSLMFLFNAIPSPGGNQLQVQGMIFH